MATAHIKLGRPKMAPPTHCKRGHAYTSENTLIFRGAHVCRKCKAERNRAYRQRLAAAPELVGFTNETPVVANHRFVKALMRYGTKHGLPNLSGLQCMSELRLLERIREEDLELAGIIERECGW